MTRRVEPLVGDVLDVLPDGCRGCLFWELGAPPPDPRTNGRPANDPVVQKAAWVSSQVLDHGAPGRVVRAGDGLAGYVSWASPGGFAPRKPPVPAISEDALQLGALWVEPHHRDGGIGRLLLQAAIKEALARGLPAVEAYGDRRWREAACLLPATWLLHEGFTVHREHPRFPLFRLETKRTARWAESMEAAVEEVLSRIPRPAPRGVPQRPMNGPPN